MQGARSSRSVLWGGLLASFLFIAGLEVGLRALGVADPPAFAPHPDYGYGMKPNQVASTRGIPFQINALGFRGPDVGDPKPESALRIAFLGDSITYGGGSVAEEELFVRRVAAALGARSEKSVEALNLAVPGWGIENMAGYVDSMGTHGADALVWVISATDLTRPRTFMEDHGFGTSKPALRLVSVATLVRLSLLGGSQRAQAERSERLERNLTLFDQALERWRGSLRLGVVFVPSREPGEDYRGDMERFAHTAETHGVPYLDVDTRLGSRSRAQLYLDPIHFNAAGHEAMAEVLEDFVWGLTRNESETVAH